MAIKFLEWLTGKKQSGNAAIVQCADFFEAVREYFARDLCFQTCIDMVANAIGRCEFRTYVRNQETRDREYYMLNVEPNVNQNSSAFWHKVIAKLYMENEALIISTTTRAGVECLVCADSWQSVGDYPQKMTEYTGVRVGDVLYNKTFKENDVLHLRLNQINVRPLLNGLYESYARMIEAAENLYLTKTGTHMKVHIGTVAQGQAEFESKFKQRMEREVVPFIKAANGVLPEFDGYDYSVLNFGAAGVSTDDSRKLIDDVFNLTARALLIPAVLVNGTIEGTADANKRFLTYVIDPLCDQIQEELNRKRYGFERWRAGDFVRVDSSSIIHFDVFENATNIEKVVGSGVFSLNDVLRAANQSPIDAEWAERHYMTLNISEMGNQTRELE